MSANKPKTTGEGSGTGDGKMADENMELDERKVKILDAVIRNYLATGCFWFVSTHLLRVLISFCY